jgi:hypothetical protein
LLLEPDLETMAGQLSQEARLLDDEELKSLAAVHLRRHAGRGYLDTGEQPHPAALQDALRAGELERARALASETAVPPTKLAMLSLEAGRADLALAQAELLVRANPGDSSALIIGLVAAALLRDEQRFRELLRRARSDELPPQEIAQHLTGLLRDSVGADAADSWRSAYLRALATSATPP